MRKTFVKILAVALSLLAMSSCGKIWDEFDSVNKELASLSDRIDELNAKLNNEVAALNEAIGTINGAIKDLQDDTKELAAELAEAGVEIEALKNADSNNLKEIQDALTQAQNEILAQLKNLSDADAAQAAKLSELSDKITALQGELDAAVAKIAVTGVEEKDGVVVLTLANGETITVSPSSNTDNTGLVTTIMVDGVEYWAVVKEDGTVESLGIPVGHPDVTVEFMVDYETKELLYSVNGGDFMPTGAYVADLDYYLVTDVINEDDYVIITIGVGEYAVEYILPKYKEDNATLVIKAGVTYFKAGEQKEFALAVEGVSEFYVMTKPDGWKAVVVDGKLVVTAPVAENVYAEAEGDVLLHGTTEAGNCKIARLSVSINVNENFKVELVYGHEFVDEETGETYTADGIYIYNNVLTEVYNQWMGTTTYSFENFYFGLAPIEAFLAGPSAYIDNQVNNYGYDISFMWYNMQFSNPYVPEVETDPWTGEEFVNENPYLVDEDYVSLSEIYYGYTYSEMPAGSQFVVWWAPIDAAGQVVPDKAQYVFYEPLYTSAEFVQATYNDIQFNYSIFGDASFYVGKYKNDPNDYYNYVNLEENLYYFQEYGSEMGVPLEKGTGTVWMSEFALDEYSEPSKLVPNTEYAVYFFPLIEGKDKMSYTYEADIQPYIYTFKTEALVEGGSAKVTTALDEERTSISSIVIDVTPSADAETVWYQFYSEDDFDAFENDSTLIADICSNGYVLSETNVAQTESYPALSPETTRVFVAIAVDKDGQYSEIYKEEYATDSVPYSEDIKVTVNSITFDTENAKKVTVVYDVTGATKLATYTSCRGSYYTSETQLTNWMLNILKTGPQYYTFKNHDVVDGQVTVEYTNYSTSNCYSTAFAYNLDENGSVSSLSVPQADDLTPVVEETPAE